MAGDAVALRAAVAAQLAAVQAQSEDGTATIGDSVTENVTLIKDEITAQAEGLVTAIATALDDLSALAIDEMEQGYTSAAGRGVAANLFRRNMATAFAAKLASLTGAVQSADTAIDVVVDAAADSLGGLVTSADGALAAVVASADTACDVAIDVQLP